MNSPGAVLAVDECGDVRSRAAAALLKNRAGHHVPALADGLCGAAAAG